MRQPKDTTKKIYDGSIFTDHYVLSVMQCIYKINQSFSEASTLAKTDLIPAMFMTSLCFSQIKELENVIEQFDVIQKERSKNIFKAMAKECSGIEKDIILTQVIPEIRQKDTYTKEFCNAITSALTQIRSQLELLNNSTHALNEFNEKLNNINQQYELFFENFNLIKPEDNTITSTILQNVQDALDNNWITSAATKYFLKKSASSEYKIQTILKNEKEIKDYIKNQKPSLPKATAIVSYIVKIIYWMPFRNTICAWILREDNTFLKKLLTYFFGKSEYKEIKQHVGLIYPKKIQKLTHIGDLGHKIHNFLQTPAGKTCIDMINAQSYFDYLQAVQQYSFIQLIKCLQQTQNRSKKFQDHTPKDFSFSYELENIASIHTQQPETQQKNQRSIALQVYQTADYAAEIFVNSGIKLFNYAISHDKQTIIDDTKKTISEYGELFFKSLSLSYRLPQKNIIEIAQRNPITSPQIITKPKTGNLTDFIHHCFDTCNKHDLDTPLGKKLNHYENIFIDMLTTHERFDVEINENYQEYKKKFKDLPEQWHDVSAKIDKLYQTLIELKKERKNLWFFQTLSDIAYKNNIRKTWQLLQQHINTYNRIKIDLYTKQDSSTFRNNFLQEFKLSHQDNIDLFNISKNNPKFDKFIYVFNPLERAEISKALIQ